MGYTTPGTPNDAVATPNTLSDMGVEAGLKLDAINKQLQMDTTLDDIYEELSDVVKSQNTEAIDVPNAIFMKLGAQPTGARTVTVPILKPLTGDLTVGAGTPIGNGATQNLLYAQFYYNEYSFSVASVNWGINYNDMSIYDVFGKIQPQMSKFMAEMHGQRIREAGLRKHDRVVGDGSIATQGWNSNWFVPNTDLTSQPAYDSTLNDFTTNIVTALKAAGGTDGSGANADLDYFLALDYYASNELRIKPLVIGGEEVYFVTVPSTQVAVLKKNNAGLLGEIYTSMVRENKDLMKYTGVIGKIGKLVLVEDQRYAEIAVTGASSITSRYRFAGNVDEREKTTYVQTSNENWDIGMLWGAGGICEWEVTPLHFEVEKQNFGRDQEDGVFGESGISLVEYDIDTPTDSSRLNIGSVVLPFATPSLSA